MNKYLKYSLEIFIGLVVFLAISAAIIFYTDSGRMFACKCVGRYLQSKQVGFSVSGVGRDFKTFDEMTIKIPSNLELHFYKVKLEGQLYDLQAKADRVIFKNFDEAGSFQEGGSSKIDVSQIVSYIAALRKFVSALELKEISFGENKVDDFVYKSAQSADTLSARINNEINFDAKIAWNFFGCENVSVNFDNVRGFSGTLNFHGDKLKKYTISTSNDVLEIHGNGSYSDLKKEIFVDSMSLFYNQRKYEISGVIYPETRSATLKSRVSLNEYTSYLDNLPEEIKSNFDNLELDLCANCNLNDKNFIDIDIIRSENTLGKMKCVLTGNELEANGDVSWISAYGFKLKSFTCKVDDFKNADIWIAGEGFDITSRLNKNSVLDFEFEVPQNGYLKSTAAFDMSAAAKIPFEFDFKDAGFTKFVQQGDVQGSGEYENGNIRIKNKSKKLTIDKYEANDLDVSYEKDDVYLKAKKLTASGLNFFDVDARLKDRELNAKCKTANKIPVAVHGQISNQKVVMDDFCIVATKSKLNVKTFEMDFANNNHKILCEILCEGKKGLVDISVANNFCDVFFNSVDMEFFRQAFGKRFPKCSVNGKLMFDMNGEFVRGKGNIRLSGLVFNKNMMNVGLSLSEAGVKLNANLENASEFFNIDANLPFLFKKDGTMLQTPAAQLRCSINGSTRIENFLELSDMKDIRGMLSCNLQISGTARAPILSGEASMKNASFLIGDIVLKNGFVSLKCNGSSNLNVDEAYFIDGKGKKATITGNGKFFFDGLIPNISTNLVLLFDQFKLFDSDDMKITVDGRGAIKGTIDDLTISGNVSIPKCEIMDFGGTGDSGNRIKIENEKNIPTKTSTEKKKDFCKYDVNMSCPNISIISKGIEIGLFGNLKLSTFQGESTLIGQLKSSGGKISIFGKRMRVIEGSVVFNQENSFDPTARFLCTNKFGELTAFLEVKNKPGKGISVRLSSHPSHSQDVILSQMMFGKDIKNLNVSEAAQLAHAISSMKNKGGILSILDSFQDTGIVDNISFSANSMQADDSLNLNEQSDSGSINISAGKYINDNVYVSVNKKSEENSASLDVDVSLSDSLSVKANTNGEAGISWKYRY